MLHRMAPSTRRGPDPAPSAEEHQDRLLEIVERSEEFARDPQAVARRRRNAVFTWWATLPFFLLSLAALRANLFESGSQEQAQADLAGVIVTALILVAAAYSWSASREQCAEMEGAPHYEMIHSLYVAWRLAKARSEQDPHLSGAYQALSAILYEELQRYPLVDEDEMPRAA